MRLGLMINCCDFINKCKHCIDQLIKFHTKPQVTKVCTIFRYDCWIKSVLSAICVLIVTQFDCENFLTFFFRWCCTIRYASMVLLIFQDLIGFFWLTNICKFSETVFIHKQFFHNLSNYLSIDVRCILFATFSSKHWK